MKFARLAVLLLLTSCQAQPDYADLTQYEKQRLNWYRCGESNLQCTTVDVPLDYADLSRGSVKLAVNRLPAAGPRLGSLLTNPGGPGSSGLTFVENSTAVFAKVRERYDIIGFDPRGIGKSERVECFDSKQAKEFLAVEWAPVTEAEKQRTQDASRDFGQACLQRSGRILPFAGTENVAKDLDLLRALLGDAKLNFLGVSYGSRIGQVYAANFPDRVGRIVLDSIDANSDAGETLTDETNSDDLRAQEAHLGRYVDNCVTLADCPLGRDRPQAMANLEGLWDRLRANPLGALTSSSAREGVLFNVDNESKWPDLNKAVMSALNGDGKPMLKLSGGDVPSGSLYAVACLIGDSAEYSHRTPATIAARVAAKVTRYTEASPHFGPMIVYSDQICDFWPVAPTLEARLLRVPSAAPIMLVNNIGDQLTPLEDAEAVASALGGSFLLTNNSTGHGVYWTLENTCARNHIDTYFLTGAFPTPTTTCS